mmetsp:Transcript_16159/g.34235  ORF Transcript_16159/g.34235 Transcript_16159/m.34235 type:complete len:128 (+) Transcript_16159:72-455(+)
MSVWDPPRPLPRIGKALATSADHASSLSLHSHQERQQGRPGQAGNTVTAQERKCKISLAIKASLLPAPESPRFTHLTQLRGAASMPTSKHMALPLRQQTPSFVSSSRCGIAKPSFCQKRLCKPAGRH